MTENIESYDGDEAEAQESFEEFLAKLFGGAPGAPAEGVQERFEALTDDVNTRMHDLDDQVKSGASRDYTLTLTTNEIRWVLSAIGWFVDSEVRDNGPVAHTLLGAAEKVLDVTASVAA